MQTLVRRLREIFAISTTRLVLVGLLLFLIPFLQFIAFEQPKYPSVFTIVERPYYDWKLRRRPLPPKSAHVAIVGIGNRSLLKLGRFPFSRTVQAQLLEKLREAKVRVVAFDLLFGEEETNDLRRQLGELLTDPRMNPVSLNKPWRNRLVSLLEQANADERFAASLSEDLPVVFGYRFNVFDWNQELQASMAFRNLNPEQRNDQRSRRRDLKQYPVIAEVGPHVTPSHLRNLLYTGIEPTLPIPVLIEKMQQLPQPLKYGFFNTTTDSDGVIRQAVLIAHYDGKVLPSLSLAAAGLYLNPKEPPRARIDQDSRNFGLEQLSIRDSNDLLHRIPVEGLGLTWINYAGPPGTIPTYELVDILEGNVSQKLLEDRLLFVGATEGTLGDNKATPVSESFPGVEIHANLAQSIITDQYLSKGSLHLWVGLFLLTAGAYLFGWMIHGFSPLGASLLAVLTIGALFSLDLSFFFPRGFILPILWAALQYFTIYVLLIVEKLVAVENERRFVELAFSRYVSRSVAQQILRNRDLLKVGGEKRELSVLFCDIAGFTELAERTDAKVIIEYLNDFFSVMTRVILAQGGTLDKYIGDAIMAFWGAPLKDFRHAEGACRAALAMQAELDGINSRWRERLNFTTKIRIGINSGEMAVGNMGSEQVFDYTVLGDNVNIASRLEGINKDYGTTILVGHQTFAQCSDRFIFRALDRIEIRGRNQISDLYEIIALRSAETPNPEWAESFAIGRAAYTQKDWDAAERAFRLVLTLKPGDRPAELYLDRINILRLHPPTSWDGVWRQYKVSG